MANGKKFDFDGMRRGRGDGDVGLREFERERGDGVGDPERGHGGGRAGGELHGDGRRVHDADSGMDVHVCLHTVANDGDAESGTDKSSAVHFGRVCERGQHRDVDYKFDEWVERIDLYSAVPEQFSEPNSRH